MPRVSDKKLFRENDVKIVHRLLDPDISGGVVGYVGATKHRLDGRTLIHEVADEGWRTEEEDLDWVNSDR